MGVHAVMCAYRTDGKMRPFDVTPDGPGSLVGRGTEQRPPESWAPSPGACSFPPPFSLSSPPSSDQYWVLITEDSMVVLSFSHLRSHFCFSWFCNLWLYHVIASQYGSRTELCVDLSATFYVIYTLSANISVQIS